MRNRIGPPAPLQTCTNRTPASTSRRASRHDWPNLCVPYASRTFAGSSSRLNAFARFERISLTARLKAACLVATVGAG